MASFLTRSEVNSVLAAILRAGVPTNHLTFSQKIENRLSVPLPFVISIKDSNFYFEIEYSWGSYGATFFPGDASAVRTNTTHHDVSSVVDRVSQWAIKVARELTEPDPWLLFGRGTLPQHGLVDAEEQTRRFNDRELLAIKKSLQEIRDYLVSEMKPNSDHLKEIDDRLNFLQEQTKIQNKRQWIYLAIGVGATIVDGLYMSPDQAHKLFMMFSDLFRNFFLKLLA